MKKIILTALLGMMSLGFINATEIRKEYNNGHAVVGFEASPSMKWEVPFNNEYGYNSCLIMVVNDATIVTYFSESLKDARNLWESNLATPISQAIQIKGAFTWIWADEPFVGTLGNGYEGYAFFYDVRQKVDGVTYDQITTGTYPDGEGKCCYHLEKYKD